MDWGSYRWAIALALGVLSLVVAPTAASADPTPGQAIAALNVWRAQLGESPVSTTPVPEWDMGCLDHNNYEHFNGVLSHQESPGAPGNTADGATAGPDSVLAQEDSSPGPFPDSQLLPGPVWDSAVFHRAALLEPRLAHVGFNASTFLSASTYTSWVCMWIQNLPGEGSPYVPPHAIDNAITTPQLTLYPSPANGAVDVPTAFPAGTESPDPGQESGVPPGARLGWLLNVEINGPWIDGGGGGIVWAHGVQATLEDDATESVVPVVVSQCGSNPCAVSGTGSTCDTSSGGTSYGCYFGGGFAIVPLEPLAPDTMYRVALSAGTVSDESNPGSSYPIPANFSWCFSTGPTFTASSDCPASGTRAEPGGTALNPTAPLGSSGGSGGSGGSRGAGAPAPTVSGTSLTLEQGFTALRFTVAAATGAPAIKSLVVKLPAGLRFSTRARSLAAGIIAGRLRFSARAGASSITIRLRTAANKLQLALSSPAIESSVGLLRKIKRHRVQRLTVVVRATDAGGKATTFRLTFAFH